MARISVTQRSASRATTSRQSRLPSCSSSSSRRLIDITACHRLTASPRPATKYFESDERSKLLSPGPINNTSILRDMREAEIHTSPPVLSSPSCVDCSFVVCEDADCLAELNPAPPACSGFDSCPSPSHQVHETCTDPVCEMEGCDGGEACDGNFEEFLQCCTDYHSYLGSQPLDSTSQINWDSWQDLLSAQPASTFSIPASPRVPADPSRSFPASSSNMNSSQQNSFPSFHQSLGGFSPPPRMASPQSQRRVAPHLNTMGGVGRGAPLMCLWANCGAVFNTMNELVGHVNLLHLRPASAPRSFATGSNRGSASANANAVSCLWGDCQTFPGMPGFAGPFAGPSTAPSNSQFDAAALSMLSSHLMQDHLGLPVQPFSMQSPTGFGSLSPMQSGIFAPRMHGRASQSHSQVTSGMPSPKSSPSQTPEPSTGEEEDHHDCASAAHICHWLSCGRSFPTCDALTAHITSTHVGSGRSHYDCYWSACNRHGEQGFASKQKILRHLQSHTGHRPFQCQTCHQNFSEAATLQQHMRRHTQEKPFVCDFPGCGKAFAITGALTIHKRTHNGDRPFKCPHCDKAFAESSNLSKHVRTHTGLRPYSCTEPGCDKCFARPDQLHRHMNVHTKKKAAQGSTPG